MTFGYLLIAAILFSCILADRFSGKFGMPALILFMAVGMIFGCDGLFKIQFDNYGVAEKVCAAALVFIMSVSYTHLKPCFQPDRRSQQQTLRCHEISSQDGGQ